MKGLKTANNENWSGPDFSICSQVKGKKDDIICMFAGIHGQFKWQQSYFVVAVKQLLRKCSRQSLFKGKGK